MSGLTWQLAFQVDINDEDNNSALMLYLVTLPPKVTKVTASYTLFCEELDAEYLTSTDFTFSGDQLAWPTGICENEDVMQLSSFTFAVELNLAAVYNENDEDIIDQYIGNRAKSPQKRPQSESTANLSKIGQSLKSLTVRVDSLTAAMEAIQKQMISMQTRMDEEQKENTNDVQQQIDEMKASLQKLIMKSDVIDDNTEEAVFKKWIVNTLKYPEYYELFVENGVDTLNVAKLVTKSELKAIGINKIGHQLKIMEGIQALKQNENKPPAPAYQQPVEGGTLMI